MPAIDLSVLCIPAECDNIKLPIECEIASRWDAYLLCDICRHFASVMLHFASLISHNLRCIPAYTHQIPMGFFTITIMITWTICISLPKHNCNITQGHAFGMFRCKQQCINALGTYQKNQPFGILQFAFKFETASSQETI